MHLLIRCCLQFFPCHVFISKDFQILFSTLYSPFVRKGLSLMQRILYLSMAYNRFTSVLNLLYEITIVLLLTLSLSPLDVPNPRVFFCYLAAYLVMDSVKAMVLNTGPSQGLHKSEAGASMLETILRWKTIRSFVFAALHIGSVTFNVTAKNHDGSSATSKDSQDSFALGDGVPLPDRPPTVAASADRKGVSQAEPSVPVRGVNFSGSTNFVTVPVDASSQQERDAAQIGDDDGASSGRMTLASSSRGSASVSRRTSTFQQDGRGLTEKTVREKLRQFGSNIRQVWFSILWSALLTFAIVWGLMYPPSTKMGTGVANEARTLSILGYGFAAAALMWHLAVVLLAFLPYTSGWMMNDLVHGHCDQFARRPNGRKYVPLAWVSLLTFFRSVILLGFISWLGYETWSTNFDEISFQI